MKKLLYYKNLERIGLLIGKELNQISREKEDLEISLNSMLKKLEVYKIKGILIG